MQIGKFYRPKPEFESECGIYNDADANKIKITDIDDSELIHYDIYRDNQILKDKLK